jgi:hypothetical protein
VIPFAPHLNVLAGDRHLVFAGELQHFFRDRLIAVFPPLGGVLFQRPAELGEVPVGRHEPHECVGHQERDRQLEKRLQWIW